MPRGVRIARTVGRKGQPVSGREKPCRSDEYRTGVKLGGAVVPGLSGLCFRRGYSASRTALGRLYSRQEPCPSRGISPGCLPGGTDFVSRSGLVQDAPIAPATLFDSPIGSTVLLDRVQRRMLCDGLAARLIGRTSLTRCRFRGSCRCDGDRDREQDASDAAIAYLHRRARGAGYPARR